MNNHLLIGIFFGAAIAGYLFADASLRLCALLQQSGYSAGRFFKWYFGKGNIQRKRLSLLSLSLALLVALFNVCFSFLGYVWANTVSIVPFVGILVLYLWAEKKYALKVRPKPSARVIRLAAAHCMLMFALCVGIGFGLAYASLALNETWFYLLRFVPFAILPMLLPFTLCGANLVMCIYEIPHNRRFVKGAKRALAESKCVKVGITGSFGKTSVKHYAAAMLSQKFSVIATPASYNTPMGIARTVKERGTDCDIFLAEMGARHAGDIAELCDLVQPAYGVITGICPQHIETFGSLEAIEKEKGTLAARVKSVVLGKSAAAISAEGAETVLREGKDFAAENIELSAGGTEFDLNIKGERVHVSTPLLGRHAAEDVALAGALCYLLGMTAEEIAAAAGKLQPVPHRLQLIEANGRNILDDSYNSNIEGAKNAVEALRLFPGKQFVVTPGLVELGALEEEKNKELGAALAGLEVILVGETLVLPVRQGYTEAGGEEEKLRIVPTLQRAQEILSRELAEGDSVLFLNDLPDIYL